jgi:hypothetical protein
MEASGIIMSIRPEHALDIVSGRKTVELRRRLCHGNGSGLRFGG